MAVLLHITSAGHWAQSETAGVHRDPSLDREGFIHCSTPGQVVETANRFFAGRADLVLLRIDPARLDVPLVFEDSYGHGEFPHLYGALNLDAVVEVIPFPVEENGGFSLPDGLHVG